MPRALGWIVVAVLAGAAAFELALALGAATIGPQPGEGAGGQEATWAAMLAMLAGIPLAPAARGSRAAALLGPAAAAFLVAFVFTFDPYYAPALRRYADGAVPLAWIGAAAALGVIAGALAWVRPRVGAVATSAVLLLLVATTVLAGDGH